MPLGIVSDEEFANELSRIDGSIHKDITRGRGPIKEVPEVIREIIAEDAILSDKSVAELASEHGVSQSSVTAYKNSATSTKSYNEPDARLQKRNDEVRGNIISSARRNLLSALQHITPEKLAEAKLRDIASVAKDMSAVIQNTEPHVSNHIGNAQFIFHVPTSKKESDYEVIDVSN